MDLHCMNTSNAFLKKTADNIARHGTQLALLLAYSIAIIFLSAHHEIWRDEMRALSIVRDSVSFLDIFKHLHNEGHPALWYVLLYIGTMLFHSTLVLKIISISIAILSAAWMLFKAPFPLAVKALFLCGVFPLYEYSVMNRNYGLGMLFIFMFAGLYRERFKKMFWMGLVVFLLSETSAPGTIISIAIFVSLLGESIYVKFRSKTDSSVHYSLFTLQWFAGMGLMVIGITAAICTMMPDKASIVLNGQAHDAFALMAASVGILVHPGQCFDVAFGISKLKAVSPVFASIVIWFLWIFFLRKPWISLILFASGIGLGLLFTLFYGGETRHQGLYFMLVIAAFWIDKTPEPSQPRWLHHLAVGVLVFLLVNAMLLAVTSIKSDLPRNYSSSKDFGMFLNGDPQLRTAIVIGEPDCFLESLPYYANNRIFIPRENRFGTYTLFTQQNKQDLSLSELLADAQELRRKERKPVLIAMGCSLGTTGPFMIHYKFNKTFTYSREGLEEFSRDTKKVADFGKSIRREDYTVYLVN
jgi:hypothetical protein